MLVGLPPHVPALVEAARDVPSPVGLIILAREARRKRAPSLPPADQGGERYGPGDVYANIPEIDDRGREQIPMFKAWNPDPIGNHERRLAAVNPSLAAIVRTALADNPGLRFVVGSGLRTEEEQLLANAWGWSPWRRGGRSPASRKHLDGDAVDLWPLDASNRVTFDRVPLAAVADAMRAAADKLGTRVLWGGDWRSRRKDPPHFELRD